MAQPLTARAKVGRQPLVAFLAATHVILPLLLLWIAPASLKIPGSWLGAALLTIEVLGLAATSILVARRWSATGALEAALIGVLIFLALPSAIVAYLGLAGVLSLVSSLVVTGIAEIALLTLAGGGEMASSETAPSEPFDLDFTAKLLLALSVLAYALMAFNVLRYTPTDSDTLWYHLPMVAEWVKTGSIAPIASVALMARGYPGAREAILTWLTLPMTSENMALLILVEVPALCFVLYALSREFGVRRNLSIAVTALFVTMPEVAVWTGSQKNDLFLALAFLCTFWFILRWLKTGHERYALLAGISAGLLCGTKMSGSAYAVTLAVVMAAALVVGRYKGRTRQLVRSLALAIVPALLIAAPWYVRNWIYFHNPVFPKGVTLFGKSVFEGALDPSFFAPITMGLHLAPLIANWKQFWEGFGPALPALIAAPPLLVLLFPWRKRFQITALTLLWLAVLPFLLMLLYMVTPFSLLSRGVASWEVQPRFLLPFAACLHLALGFLLSKMRGVVRIAMPLIAVAAIANIALWSHFWWLIAASALAIAIGAAWLERSRQSDHTARMEKRVFKPAVIVILLIAGAVASHWLDGFREQRKASLDFGYQGDISPGWGKVSLYVYQNLSNKKILFLGRPEDFPLYGRGYTNDLYTAEDDNAWDLLQHYHIDYVVGFRSFVRYGAEGETWQYLAPPTAQLKEAHPGKFEPVYAADGAELLRVIQ